MFEITPEIAGAASIVVALGGAAAYNYFTGNDTSVSVDTDNDGKDDLNVDFESDDQAEDPAYKEGGDVNTNSTDDESPVPEDVQNIEDLTNIKGIGKTRAKKLQAAGLDTANDLYLASDATIKGVDGFGPRAVSYIRDDIGGIDYSEGNTESSEGEDGSTSSDETSDAGSDGGEATDDGSDNSGDSENAKDANKGSESKSSK